MSVQTLNPTVNTTPDQGSTLAVDGNNNNGHGSTVTNASVNVIGPDSDSQAQAKSARWSSFQSLSPFNGKIVSLKLKFNWSVSGSVDAFALGGNASASISFVIQYSIDGGTNWITQVSKSRSTPGSQTINESGSEEIVLSPSQNISLIQVRDKMNANANGSAGGGGEATGNADVTTTISGIILEAQIIDVSRPILIM